MGGMVTPSLVAGSRELSKIAEFGFSPINSRCIVAGSLAMIEKVGE